MKRIIIILIAFLMIEFLIVNDSIKSPDLAHTEPSVIETTLPEVTILATEPSTEPPTEPPVEPTVPSDLTMPTESVEPTESFDDFEAEWSDEAIYLAKTIWGEARGLSEEGWEKVAWCILNRVDDPRFPNNIIDVITAPNQFHGYSSSYPCEDEMYELALNTIWKWQAEKRGEEVERLLGKEYIFFSANKDGTDNIYRTEW